MKITCLDKQVSQMLSEAYYKIPRFQRPYSWDTGNLEEFWNDTIVENESDYFIGNFVVYQDKEALGVVDGQQRLTTITLLLCALRNAFTQLGEQKLAEGLHGLIERANIRAEKFYVLQTETSYPYLQEHIQKFEGEPDGGNDVGPEERMLKAAFEFLTAKVSLIVSSTEKKPSISATKKKELTREELSKVRDKILSLKLIFTALENDDDAYVIFETLNTRGKDLTLSDLVKSHLSRLLKPANKNVDLAKDKWNEMNELFEESQADLNISTFILHHWLSRYEYTTENKLYKTLKKHINKQNAAPFLNDLVLESKIYRGIHEPSYLKWNKEELAIRDSLAAMNLFRIKQQLPMVLSVMRHHEDGSLKLKHVRGMCRAIENFHFIFTAVSSQRSSGGISFMYASSARNLYEAGTDSKKIGVLHALKQKLSDRLPPFGESAARFEELKFSSLYTKQKSIVRYILHKMYEHNAKGAALDLEKMTIEHIAPENPPQASGLTEEDVASIGNLILVTHELNNKLANKNFDQKKAILKQSGIWVDDMLLNAKRWGRDVIEERAIKMAQQAYDEVWTI